MAQPRARHPRPPRSRPQRRGVSLIEAVVALGVMATGLLGVVGVQGTLRANSDIARQRADAVRLAQQRIEDLRFFRDVTGASPAYDGIAGSLRAITPPNANTEYTVSTTVTPMDPNVGTPDLQAVPRAKGVVVTVTWADRTGQPQSVTLGTAIAGIAPALAGSLAVPPEGNSVVRQPGNRERGIPPNAVNLGDGRSALRPQGPGGGVVWVFNNVSGVITRCALAPDAALTAASIDANAVCTAARYRLVSGVIRFSLGGSLTEDEVRQPSSDRPANLDALAVAVVQTAPATPSQPECSTIADAATRRFTGYLCAVPIDPLISDSGWSGSLQLSAPSLSDVPSPSPYKVCRYLIDRQDLAPPREPGLPWTVALEYGSVRTSLVNRNFLIIPRSVDCPFAPPQPLPLPLPDPLPLWLVQHQPTP